ncbi:MAG: hypothetical protein JW819_02050 [Candidatus Krumholzibacteriota bacterium]|nr:hypothetical protein [Candidatus Krumholzibacteriota bacterium]
MAARPGHRIRARAAAAALLLAATLLAAARGARGAGLWSAEDGERWLRLTTTLKSTGLVARAPADSVLYPERWSAASLWRLRLDLDARPAPWLAVEAAYLQRLQTLSAGAGAALGKGILPAAGAAPYRVDPLEGALVEAEGLAWRHELDRAAVRLQRGRLEAILGRQGVGWGRAVLLGAVDVFSPFSPLEHDREWRRGVDAARLRLAGPVSLDAVAVLGEIGDRSAFLVRAYGYHGRLDGELIVGKRREDVMAGLVLSAVAGDAELHFDAAWFGLDEFESDPAIGRDSDAVVKATLGGSWSADLHGPLLLLGELHYCGFGVEDVAALDAAGDDLAERLLHGDLQVLGRRAAALQASWGVDLAASLGAAWLLSIEDGSGVATLSADWTVSDELSLSARGYLAHGARPAGGAARSEHGGTPASLLVQMSFTF